MTARAKGVTIAAVCSVGPAIVGLICEAIWRQPSAFSLGMLVAVAALGITIMFYPAMLIDWIDRDLHKKAVIPFEEYQRAVWLWPVGTPRACTVKWVLGQTCIQRNEANVCDACAAMLECRKDYQKDMEET